MLAWFYGVSTNVVRNRSRSERRFALALRAVPPPRAQPDISEEAIERLDDERQMQHALALLAALPKREQDVFSLCGWMGLAYEDAALALGIPVGTVRSRLSRARKRLLELSLASGHEEGGTVTFGRYLNHER